jgi:hypothetical protein
LADQFVEPLGVGSREDAPTVSLEDDGCETVVARKRADADDA